eukprot:CAMPEP_0114442496 /NCGR_PEP_ID=MMETSP0103-20121206/16979_1 /TAXON_ID=37642 ORGANISM="Paraphysomonas imperforata, Strain PA2" /NCGR_SAMPLE_ID=MMETSP0103 /ASSEMBLY_ACC=CAM_ASM_000201 /LENGTH=202 /DNA_ID=CAMNT_0001613761 /DNA_START=142 /DNA_END=747 /DNA_ORIENTATION=+
MNEIVVQSNERQVLVHRSYYAESGEQVVELVGSSSAANSESKGVYYPGEELTVTVSDDKSGSLNTEYLFETSRSGGRFLGEERGCRHTRTNVNSQVLTMPPFKTDVRVWVGWAAEHGVVKVSHSLELQPATDLSRSHKPAAAWADKPGHDSQEGEAVGEGEEEGDGSAPQESGEGDGEDRDEEEYKFPEDLIEYLLFSQLGP